MISLLVCDVGNSRVKFGLFDLPEQEIPSDTTPTSAAATPAAGEKSVSGGKSAVGGKSSRVRVKPVRPLLPVCRFSVTVDRSASIPWDELRQQLRNFPATSWRGVLGGSHPLARDQIAEEWSSRLGFTPRLLASPDLQRCLSIEVEEPAKVGIDRLLNAVAANVLRASGQPAVIVDSGTATTVDYVDAAGRFRGGAILPGFELAARSLHEYTALLPSIGMEELTGKTPTVLGRNTRAALRSGLFWGHLGAVKELVERFFRLAASGPEENDRALTRTESSSPSLSPLLLLTGGGAGLLHKYLQQAKWEPYLSLQGLVLASHDELSSG